MKPDIRQELEAVLVRIAEEHGIAIKRLSVDWLFGQTTGGRDRSIEIACIGAIVDIVETDEKDVPNG